MTDARLGRPNLTLRFGDVRLDTRGVENGANRHLEPRFRFDFRTHHGSILHRFGALHIGFTHPDIQTDTVTVATKHPQTDNEPMVTNNSVWHPTVYKDNGIYVVLGGTCRVHQRRLGVTGFDWLMDGTDRIRLCRRQYLEPTGRGRSREDFRQFAEAFYRTCCWQVNRLLSGDFRPVWQKSRCKLRHALYHYHEQHICAVSCMSRLESQWETFNFDPRKIENYPVINWHSFVDLYHQLYVHTLVSL